MGVDRGTVVVARRAVVEVDVTTGLVVVGAAVVVAGGSATSAGAASAAVRVFSAPGIGSSHAVARRRTETTNP